MSRLRRAPRARSRMRHPRSLPRAALRRRSASISSIRGPSRRRSTRGSPFDVLVNNAGINRPAAFADVSVEDFDAITGLSVRSAFFVAQAVARRLIAARRTGSIIHMSSQMGLVGGAKRTVYCASKHAIQGLTKVVAIDLAPHRLRVNAICPTFIETTMTRPFLETATFPRRRFGEDQARSRWNGGGSNGIDRPRRRRVGSADRVVDRRRWRLDGRVSDGSTSRP